MESEPKPEKGIDAVIRHALARDGVFTKAEADAHGVFPSALTRALGTGRIIRILPRVYVVAGCPATWWGHARAGVGWCGGALSHLSAAFALGLVEQPPATIDLVAPTHRKPREGSRYRCHVSPLLSPPHIVEVRGVPVTAAARTLLDLARQLPEPQLECALEQALRQRLVSASRMEWQLRVEGGRGRPGTAVIRKLLGRLDPKGVPTESTLEARVAQWFRTTRLPPPERQYRVFEDGRCVARIDFAYPEASLAIEVQSFQWHSGRQAWARDQVKERDLRRLGWDVLPIVQEDLDERSWKLEAEIARRLGLNLF